MKNKTTGLVFGKFAPLHKGHQFLIEEARKRTDNVIVLVYDRQDVTPIPVSVRAGWIRALYPNVTVVEIPAGPPESKSDPAIMQAHIDFIKEYLPGPVTHLICSEWYGPYISEGLGAELIKLERGPIAVSGTLARENPEKYRDFMEPMVYEDLIKYAK